MAKTQEGHGQPAKKNTRRVNGIVIALIFFVLDLILLGAFGRSGKAVTDFLVGIFGYAIYGYSFGLTLLGVFYIFNRKAKQSKKIILIYALIVVTTITFAHIIGSHGYALNGWGNYISTSYREADTAGGALASIFLYLFATRHIYVLTLVANGVVTVGLIAIAVLLQVNIDIPIGSKRPRKVRGASDTNMSFYTVDGERKTQTLNNQTVAGRDLGEKLSHRGSNNRLDNYQPMENLNLARDSQSDFADSTYNGANYADNYNRGASQQDDTQLILDTGEIRSEANRDDYIYARNDLPNAEDVATISSVQRDYLGIDPSERLNVVDEGGTVAPNQTSQQPPRISQREITQSIFKRFQSDSRASDDYTSNGRIPSYYSQLHQQDDRIEPVNRNQGESDAPQNTLSFNERLNKILNSSEQRADQSGIDYSTEYSRAEDSNDQSAVDNVEYQVEETNSQSTSSSIEHIEIVDDKKVVESDKKVVEDRTETRQEESMEEYIARMNSQKQKDEPSPVKNYNINVYKKEEKKEESGDGYFKKTYDKPTPIASKQNEQQPPKAAPTIVNGASADKHTETVAEKKEDKPKRIITPYIPPSIDDLNDYRPNADETENYNERANIIERTYANFGIEVHVKNIVNGPSVTRYEFEIPETLDVTKIPSKLNNILMALAVETARIEAPIPGKSLCGIEVPNKVRKTVGLKEFVASDTFKNKEGGLHFALGKDVDGNCHYEDLSDFPHGLIAGGTGSGKSVCINTMLCSLLYKYSPEELRIALVDPKIVELGKYEGIPHLLTPKIYNNPAEAVGILKWLCAEMERRYLLLASLKASGIKEYNRKVKDDGEKMPYILTVIDEFGDIMIDKQHGDEVEACVIKLAQKARASGIHLILATQRPTADVIRGNIKSNLPARITFAVASGIDSRVILDSNGAEDLLGKGDMLFMSRKMRYMRRLQNPFISDEEIERVIDDIIKHNSVYYDESIAAEIDAISAPKKEEPAATKPFEKQKEFDFPDDLCPDVLKRIVGIDNVSVSWMQRSFSIGFPRGGKIFDWLMNCGYIEKQGNKCVCVLSAEDVDEIIEGARTGGDGDGE